MKLSRIIDEKTGKIIHYTYHSTNEPYFNKGTKFEFLGDVPISVDETQCVLKGNVLWDLREERNSLTQKIEDNLAKLKILNDIENKIARDINFKVQNEI